MIPKDKLGLVGEFKWPGKRNGRVWGDAAAVCPAKSHRKAALSLFILLVTNGTAKEKIQQCCHVYFDSEGQC